MRTTKDPQAKLDYGFSWIASDGTTNDGSASDDGFLQGDTISDSTWTVNGADSALVASAPTFNTTGTTVWLEAGTEGLVYQATNHITTAGGRETDRTMFIEILQK